MTRNMINILISLVVFVGIIVFNNKIMPVRKEITELELTKVIGMDMLSKEEKYKYAQTIVRIESEEKKADSGGGEESSGGSSSKAKLLTVEGATYADIIRSFQTYINKSLTGSHIKHILLGEDFVKNDISEGIDFNARDYEIRLNSSIYITKETSAKDFLYKAVNSSYDLDQKITKMEKNVESKSVSKEFTMIDLLKILVSDGTGLVPTLKIISEEKENTSIERLPDNVEFFSLAKVTTSENSETLFDFGGYAILKEKKLLGYLNERESIMVNILTNKAKGTNLNIKEDDGKLVSFGILGYKSKFSFEFEGDTLKKIKANIEFRTNFDEISSKENVFKLSNIKDLEEKQNKKMEEQALIVLNKIKEYNADFLDLKEKIKIEHPYKYKKQENEILNQIMAAEFEVRAISNIERTYDYTSINE